MGHSKRNLWPFSTPCPSAEEEIGLPPHPMWVSFLPTELIEEPSCRLSGSRCNTVTSVTFGARKFRVKRSRISQDGRRSPASRGAGDQAERNHRLRSAGS